MNEKTKTLCQCHVCGNLFEYSNLPEDNRIKHISPCCRSSYSVLSPVLDRFFQKFYDINNDEKYYL